MNIRCADDADGARVWAERLGAAGLQYDDEAEEWEEPGDEDDFEEGEEEGEEGGWADEGGGSGWGGARKG